jgi:hypothetical protein
MPSEANHSKVAVARKGSQSNSCLTQPLVSGPDPYDALGGRTKDVIRRHLHSQDLLGFADARALSVFLAHVPYCSV